MKRFVALLLVVVAFANIVSFGPRAHAEVGSCLAGAQFWITGDDFNGYYVNGNGYENCTSSSTRTFTLKVCDDLANQSDHCSSTYSFTGSGTSYSGTRKVYRNCGNMIGDSRGFYAYITISDSTGSRSWRSGNVYDC